jgi:ankyrin repeat protein
MAKVNMDELLAAVVAGDVAQLQAMMADTCDAPEDGVHEPSHHITSLMIAAACGNEAVVGMLLQCGVDPACRDEKGRTAAAYARASGHPHLAVRLDTVVDQEKTMR